MDIKNMSVAQISRIPQHATNDGRRSLGELSNEELGILQERLSELYQDGSTHLNSKNFDFASSQRLTEMAERMEKSKASILKLAIDKMYSDSYGKGSHEAYTKLLARSERLMHRAADILYSRERMQARENKRIASERKAQRQAQERKAKQSAMAQSEIVSAMVAAVKSEMSEGGA